MVEERPRLSRMGIELQRLVDREHAQIHLFQVGKQRLRDIGLLLGDRFAAYITDLLDVVDRLARRAAQQRTVYHTGGSQGLDQHPALRLGLHILPEPAHSLQIALQLVPHHKDPFALNALQEPLSDQG